MVILVGGVCIALVGGVCNPDSVVSLIINTWSFLCEGFVSLLWEGFVTPILSYP